MRLTDDLAERRRLYARPAITAPAMMVIDIPRHLAGDDLPLGRYYPVILETDEELVEFEEFLNLERPDLVVPDILATRPGLLHTAAIAMFEYVPPEPGWPWVLLVHWPQAYAEQAAHDPEMMARGAYTMDLFLSRADLLAAVAILVEKTGGPAGFSVINGHGVPQRSA